MSTPTCSLPRRLKDAGCGLRTSDFTRWPPHWASPSVRVAEAPYSRRTPPRGVYSTLRESIFQKRVRLCDSGSCRWRVGKGVEHDEVMDRAVVPGGGDCDARDSELASIGLALIPQYIILGRDDECGWQTL